MDKWWLIDMADVINPLEDPEVVKVTSNSQRSLNFVVFYVLEKVYFESFQETKVSFKNICIYYGIFQRKDGLCYICI